MKRKKPDKTLRKIICTATFIILFCFCFHTHVFGEEKDICPPEIKVEITDADKEFTSKVRKATVIITDDKMKGEIKKEYVFKEGRDNFHISIKDAAGNVSTYRSNVYVQDYTAPSESTIGIYNGQIINEKLDVSICATEEWLDEEKSFVTITGKNSRDKYKYFFEGNKICIYDDGNFKDDFYTMIIFLSDKAGNTCEREIDFTVNRRGSSFAVNKRNKKIIGCVANDIKDFCITEKNLSRVDTDSARILFAFNGRVMDIKKGADYGIEEKKDADGYTYTYIFYDDLFIKDGVYTLSISTMDEAGNVNDTSLRPETDEIRFAVKKGATDLQK